MNDGTVDLGVTIAMARSTQAQGHGSHVDGLCEDLIRLAERCRKAESAALSFQDLHSERTGELAAAEAQRDALAAALRNAKSQLSAFDALRDATGLALKEEIESALSTFVESPAGRQLDHADE